MECGNKGSKEERMTKVELLRRRQLHVPGIQQEPNPEPIVLCIIQNQCQEESMTKIVSCTLGTSATLKSNKNHSDKLSDLLSHGQARIIAAMRSLGHTVSDHDGRRSQGSRVPVTAASCGAMPGDYNTPSTRGEQDETARGTGGGDWRQ